MARRRFRKRRAPRRYFSRLRSRIRHRDNRIPLAPTLTLVGTVMAPCPSGRTILGDFQSGDWNAALYDAREKFAGIDNTGKLRPEWLIATYSPLIVAGLVSKVAGKFVNPYFKKIPIVGKHIKL